MKLAAVLIALCLPGCAQFLKVQDKSAEQIVKGVNIYCDSTDEAFRASFRESINTKLAPRHIQVDC